MVAQLPVRDGSSGACGPSPGGCNPNARCGNGLEKVYPTCAVRYGYMNYVGEFRYAPGMLFGCGQKVVIQSNRGMEIGRQVSLTCTGCEKSISRQQMLKYVKNSGPDFLRLKAGRILRAATAQDLDEQAHLDKSADEELRRTRELAAEFDLPMKLVACEHLLGGERIVLHFMSETRVDFRELVRALAHEFHTRIEMHQVGARDEARLAADYEICGRECCCKNFLKTLRPVTMRMAKLQKATLDPSKVSGRCGRLRCCLRYEHEGYESLDKKLPRMGALVRTGQGSGKVVDRQILTQLLLVEFDGGRIETIAIEDVLTGDAAAPARPEARKGPPVEGMPSDGGNDPHDPRRDEAGDDGGETEPMPRDADAADERSTTDAGPPRPMPGDPQVGDARPVDSSANAGRPEPGRRGRRNRRGRRGRRGGPGGDRNRPGPPDAAPGA